MANLIGEGEDQVLHALGQPKKTCNKHDDCDAEDEARAAEIAADVEAMAQAMLASERGGAR